MIGGFQVFDVSAYTNKPAEFRQFTIPSNILPAWAAWGNHPNTGNAHPNELPPEETVRQVARRFNYDNPIAINLEQYPTKEEHSDNDVAASVGKLLTIMDWIRDERPNSKVGFYDIVPNANWFMAYDEHYNAQRRIDWMAANDRVQALADAADWLAPSLYTQHPKDVFPQFPDLWENYLRRNIEEARRLANGKPVYPFMWPKLSGEYLTGEDWLFQIDILQQDADGMMFWGGAGEFDRGGWWREMLSFLQAV